MFFFLRWVLFWVQALASERELVHALFDIDSADHKSTAKKTTENDSLKAAESDFTFVLDRIFEGVCRPFKVRVEQVLQSQPSLIISYKLTNTLEFYSYTVSFIDLFWYSTSIYHSSGFHHRVVPHACRSQIYSGETLLSVIQLGWLRMLHRKPSSTFLKPEGRSFYVTLHL